MNYRVAAAVLAAVFAVLGTNSEATTVGVAVDGFGSATQAGTTEFRSALGADAIKYYIPLGGSDCTYGVGTCGVASDSGTGGAVLSMWMLFDGVSTTGPSRLSVNFEDLDLINANDPPWFLETTQIYRSDGTSLTGLIDDITGAVPNGSLGGNHATQQLLTVDLGLLPSDKLWLRYEFTADSQFFAGNTSEYLTASIASIAPVPLPAAGWLLLSAIGGLGLIRHVRSRRRRN